MRHCSFNQGLAVIAALALVVGCRHHERQPLDLQSHRADLLARSPSSAEVAAFAQHLAETGRVEIAAYDSNDGLSLAEAEVVALFFNPELRLARLQANVARANAEHAGLWEDPVLEVDALRVVESVAEPWILAGGLAFTIPISGRLGAEKSAASAEYQAELSRVALREWTVISQLRAAWLELSAALLRASLARDALADLDAIVSIVDRLEAAGEMVRVESRLFRLERSIRSGELTRLDGLAAALQVKVMALMGLTAGANLDLQTSLALPDLPESTHLAEWLEDSPALAVRRGEYEVAEQSLALELRKQYPDIGLGPLYEHEEGQSRIGVGVSLPLLLLNGNRSGIEEALARRDAARGAFEAEYDRLTSDLLSAQVEHEAAHRVRTGIERDVAPMVDQQIRDVRRLAELGELNTLLQLESLIRAQEVKMSLIDARLAEALTAARILELIGPHFDPETKPGETK